MGRGAQQQTIRMTDQQLASQNAMNQQLYGQGSSLANTAATGYQNLLANPGYTPQQQSAINSQSMGALASAFGALANSAANRVARTRNSAGYGDLLDALAREQGRQTSSVAQQNQLAFANQSRQDQLTALQGLSGLYGVDTSLLGRTLGIPAQLLNTRANLANAPGFGSTFAQALGGTLGGGLAGLGIRYAASRF
jgi:carbamoylphosphate synthase small subunit